MELPTDCTELPDKHPASTQAHAVVLVRRRPTRPPLSGAHASLRHEFGRRGRVGRGVKGGQDDVVAGALLFGVRERNVHGAAGVDSDGTFHQKVQSDVAVEFAEQPLARQRDGLMSVKASMHTRQMDHERRVTNREE